MLAGRFAPWRVAALAGAIYLANFRVIGTGDAVGNRYVPFALWKTGTVYLDSVGVAASAGTRPYWLTQREGRLVPNYPLVLPVLVAPLYGPAVAYLAWRGETPWRLERVAVTMEKAVAAAISAASAGLLFALLRRGLAGGRALLLVAAFAFGSSTWTVSSQSFWQHGLGQLLVVLVLLLGTAASRPVGRPGWSFIAGALLGLMVANRTGNLPIALPLFAALIVMHPRRGPLLVAGAFAGGAPFAALNLALHGHVLGWHAAALGAHRLDGPFWSGPWLFGVIGLLVGPAKGLFVFSPWLLALAAYADRGVRALWREQPLHPHRYLAVAVGVGAAAQTALFGGYQWLGGYCYGPRFLLEALPGLVWLTAPLAAGWRTRGLTLFRLAAVVAVSFQIVGAFCYPSGQSDEIYNPDPKHWWRVPEAAWEWRNFAPWLELRGGLAEPDLLPGRWRVRPEWSG
jgi:hypothetical protein